MKNGLMRRKNSFIFRWILIVQIVMIPFEALNLYANISNSKSVLQETQQSVNANLNYLCESFDTGIQNLYWQLDQLLTNVDVQSLYTLNDFMSDSEYYMKAGDVINLLSFVVRSNPYLSGITLYYPKIQLYLSTNVPHIRSFQLDDFNQRLSVQSQNELMDDNGRFYLGRSDISSSQKGPVSSLYYAEAIINMETISELLSSFNRYSASNAIMLRRRDGTIVKSSTCVKLSQNEEEQLRELLADADNTVKTNSIQIDRQAYTIFFRISTQTKCIFCQLVSNELLYGITNRMRIFSSLIILLSFGILFLFVRIAHHDVYLPMTDLKTAFQKIGEGNFDVDLRPNYSDEFNELANHLNQMAAKLDDLVKNNYLQQVLIQKAKFKHLQAQISPHFLYNSFYFLENMIDLDDLESAKAFLNHLSKYYQYLTWNDSDMVLLKDEYSHALDYLTIQKMRFRNHLSIHTEEIPTEWREESVPRLILQPILENSLTYSRQPDRATVIHVSFHVKDQRLTIFIEDNGATLSEADIESINNTIQSDESPSALHNISQRLSIYYHQENLLTACRSDLGGLCIGIHLQRRNGNELD